MQLSWLRRFSLYFPYYFDNKTSILGPKDNAATAVLKQKILLWIKVLSILYFATNEIIIDNLTNDIKTI